MGEWERCWRGPPHDKTSCPGPRSASSTLRVMVADTYPGVRRRRATGPGDDSEEDDDCDDWEGRCSRPETCATTCARRSVVVQEPADVNGRALRQGEIIRAGVRFDSRSMSSTRRG